MGLHVFGECHRFVAFVCQVFDEIEVEPSLAGKRFFGPQEINDLNASSSTKPEMSPRRSLRMQPEMDFQEVARR